MWIKARHLVVILFIDSQVGCVLHMPTSIGYPIGVILTRYSLTHIFGLNLPLPSKFGIVEQLKFLDRTPPEEFNINFGIMFIHETTSPTQQKNEIDTTKNPTLNHILVYQTLAIQFFYYEPVITNKWSLEKIHYHITRLGMVKLKLLQDLSATSSCSKRLKSKRWHSSLQKGESKSARPHYSETDEACATSITGNLCITSHNRS